MSQHSNGQTEVLIAGAGPTGLVLAIWLTKLGVSVRIIDKTAEPGTTHVRWPSRRVRWSFIARLGMADAARRRWREGSGSQLLGPGQARSRGCPRIAWARA